MSDATAWPPGSRTLWNADNGDGTYRNPVMHTDWSDPDVIRVGDDFYLVASSFHRVPGLPILHSRDLVSWSIVGHGLQRLEPEEVFRTPQHGCGIWAPAIRHHNSQFWIFYPDPDRGIFVITATDPAGPWSKPHLLKAGLGLIDPCPLWDGEGSAYLLHAWAKSRAGINNMLTCQAMTPDAAAVCGPEHVVIDGHALADYRTLEGPKFYRHDGWYYIFAPAGGVTNGWQSVFRSRRVFGPYEDRIVLVQGDTAINGPHQGAWVTTASGQDWFVHFQDKGAFGRVVHLQPMRWLPSGWPEIGTPTGHGPGQPVLAHAKPKTAAEPPAHSTVDSAGAGAVLGPEWTWAANPEPCWWSLSPDGGLRLACIAGDTGDLRQLPNLLGQRLPADRFRATTTIGLSAADDGSRAGLAVLGASYAWAGLTRTANGTFLVCRTASAGDPERDTIAPTPVPPDHDGETVSATIAVDVDPEGRCQFFASTGTQPLQPVGAPFTATAGQWVGATLGLFAAAPPLAPDSGHAHVASFHLSDITHHTTTATASGRTRP